MRPPLPDRRGERGLSPGNVAHFAQVLGKTCYEVSHRYTAPCDQAGEECPLGPQPPIRPARARRASPLRLRRRVCQSMTFRRSGTPTRGEIVAFIRKAGGDPRPRGSRTHGVSSALAIFREVEFVVRVAKSDATVLFRGRMGSRKGISGPSTIQDTPAPAPVPRSSYQTTLACQRRCSKGREFVRL